MKIHLSYLFLFFMANFIGIYNFSALLRVRIEKKKNVLFTFTKTKNLVDFRGLCSVLVE